MSTHPVDLSSSYDDVPYNSLAFPQTHPDRLATIGRLFGIASADARRCRVLELGCSDGGNLIPLAVNLPEAEFVGIDLSRNHVAAAAKAIETLGLGNITIAQQSILDFDDGWGKFDYIICHGVFSWVDAAVQDAILATAATHLTDHGIAYVSYNTYPGWHMREMVRHMMRYHAGRFDEPSEQIEQARALLEFLASATANTGHYGELLASERGRLAPASDTYLFHEHLERNNMPLYFHQFVERVGRAGLQYLAEAEVSTMLTSRLDASVADTLEEISPDILHLEQYMDFVRNRQFRQSLLCRGERSPVRELTPEFMDGLQASSLARTETEQADLTDGVPVVFAKGEQRATIAFGGTKTALQVLIDSWPQAVGVDELTSRALAAMSPARSATEDERLRRLLLGDLLACFTHGVIGLHTIAPPCVTEVSATPRANSWARYQAHLSARVVNVHHHTIQLDDLSRAVLQLLNGQRTPQDIVSSLVEQVEHGTIRLESRAAAATTREDVETVLSAAVSHALNGLARSALLSA